MLRWMTRKERRTDSIAMKGEAMVQSLTKALVAAGCWFTVQPLPDQVWRITVKADDMPALLAAMARYSRTRAAGFRPRMR